MTILSILRSGFFVFFSGMGSGCLKIGGGRGVSRSGEVNPSAALSGTGFDEAVGGLLCFCALTFKCQWWDRSGLF